MQQARAAERIAAQRAHMQAFVDRFRAKATKARQAQSRLKALERLPALEAVIEDAPTRFDFPEPKRLAPPILTLERVAAGYDGTRGAVAGSTSASTWTTASRCSAPTATARARWPSCWPGGWSRWRARCAARRSCAVGYFAQHQTDELVLERDADRPHGPRAAATRRRPQVRSQLARFGLDADRAGSQVAQPLRRREGAAAAGAGHPRRAAIADPRRADQPSRYRCARGAGAGAGRFRGRGAADHPRPASGGAGGRPAVAGGRRHGAPVRRRHGRVPRAAGRARPPAPRAEAPTPARRPPRPGRGARAAGAAAPPGARTPRRCWPSSPTSGRGSRRSWPTRRCTRRAGPTTSPQANQRLAAIARETEAAEMSWLEASEALEAAS